MNGEDTMIKKCVALGLFGIVFGGLCLSEIGFLNSKYNDDRMQEKGSIPYVKTFNLTGYVVGIHQRSNIVEVATVETKEAAIEFSKKRNDFINLAVEDKFVLIENEDNQEYEIGEKIKISAEKTERINHLIKIVIDPDITKVTTEKLMQKENRI